MCCFIIIRFKLICLQEETTPYSFFVNDTEIEDSLVGALSKESVENTEQVLEIIYQPQAVFRVRAVTRCTSSIEGHAEAVIAVAFSPDGRFGNLFLINNFPLLFFFFGSIGIFHYCLNICILT